jgi:hypothetical protein
MEDAAKLPFPPQWESRVSAMEERLNGGWFQKKIE